MAGGRRRQLGEHGDAEARFDQTERTGEVRDFIGPVQLEAMSRQRIVDQRAIAAVAADGDNSVRRDLGPAHLFARCQRMVMAAGEDERILNELLEFNLGI